jgi:predicted dithiol-disulfide oxidoreductase (DUF899 family)
MQHRVVLEEEWLAAGCPGCSFLADHIDGALPHLEHHDVTLTAVSRAPLAEIEAYQRRMGWNFPWVSAFGSDFNYDYHVSFAKDDLAGGKASYNFTEAPARADAADTDLPAMSAFYKDEAGEVFHTYSSYARSGGMDWHVDDPGPRAHGPQREDHHGFCPSS